MFMLIITNIKIVHGLHFNNHLKVIRQGKAINKISRKMYKNNNNNS